ncbi:MAG: hypothetical protein ACR2NP_13015 [Pirellulaceae bacterium]
MRLSIPRKFFLVIVPLVLVGIGSLLVLLSTRYEPAQYRKWLAVSPEQNAERGLEFERNMVELSNRIRLDQDWTACLTHEQINGWLAADLPQKFPEVLPSTVSEPRVVIRENEIDLVFRIESGRFRGVVTVTGEVFCTDVDNQLAFRIGKVRSGVLPVPMSWWAGQLESSLRTSDILLSWSRIDGDPVAMINLPASFEHGEGTRPTFESIVLRPGQITISGRSQHEVVAFQSFIPVDSDGDTDNTHR